MAQTIQIKRGLSASLASLTLLHGEIAVALDTGEVYIGTNQGKMLINKLTSKADLGLENVDNTSDADKPISTAVQAALNDKADLNALGSAAAKNTGTESGNIPVLDVNGKLDTAVIPSIAITDTFEVATQADMLALSAQQGDVAIRSDLNKCFILKTAPASSLGNWVELKTPTDAVISVNGKTGAVTLTYSDIGAASAEQGTKADSAVQSVNSKSGTTITLTKEDIGLGNINNTSDADKPVSTAVQAALDEKMGKNDLVDGGTF